ncbi:CHAT domain-containing protein [Paraburkholderia sabiae]|uniref:CHAT domain-containing protein n=1 Tax=Paraburkholderia sabiae TaxID=273251 RepID=UPI001CAC747A|nr:CHAT domain-containing protein [Paraburkholderia sabiae]CAG9223645.1 CHAT domain-containing protein [Paraburkholderia sabiae]
MQSIETSVPPQVLAELPQPPQAASAADAGNRLKISVVNGNLQFVQEALLLGHYRDASLTGVERVVDGLIGGALNTSIRLGRYPQHIGTQQVFVNAGFRSPHPFRLPRPAGLIVVGLGSEGQLRAADLVTTVRLGVIAWSQRLAENAPDRAAPFVLAATLIGSGGSGIAAGQAARLVAEGVRDANLRLRLTDWPCVGHLRLIELYMDRSTEAWRSLKLLEQASPDCYAIDDAVSDGTGGLKRPLDSSYRGADYDLISAITQNDASGETNVVYTLDTRRARTEVRATATQGRLLTQLVKAASNADNDDANLGLVLYQLLVPREMQPFLAGGSEMQIEVDSGTAGIPWEMLDSAANALQRNADSPRPWAIRAKLLRKLRIGDFRHRVDDASREAQILVIGEPYVGDPRYPALPGARQEADAVAQMLSGRLGLASVMPLVAHSDGERGPDARRIVSTLLERDWRVLHISGHGEPPADEANSVGAGDDRLRGVVLSDGIFLGPREIRMLQRTPQLVFVNCCYLAARSGDQLLKAADTPAYDRPRYAANVAESLIRIGVKCVIAAGWAVDDEPAQKFATTFYQRLLDGERFLDAVAAARDAAWLCGGNTWAAYQCYGDANWTLDMSESNASVRERSPDERYAGIASAVSLVLALEELETGARFEAAGSTERLQYLDTRFGKRWGSQGNVAEAFGRAWSAAKNDDKAVAWYAQAVSVGDGRATFNATDQLANLQCRLAWTALKAKAAQPGGASADDIEAARSRIGDSLRLLESLLAVQRTVERVSICASAYKRIALTARVAGDAAAESAAIGTMLDLYREAEQIGNARGEASAFYPLMNRLAAELMCSMGAESVSGFDADSVARLRRMLEQQAHDEPNFWNISAGTELRLYESLAAKRLDIDLAAIRSDFDDLHTRVPSPGYWSSVLDQCDFVLNRYANQTAASVAEKTAAGQLLAMLEKWVD